MTNVALFGGASLRALIDYFPTSGAMERQVSSSLPRRTAGQNRARHRRLAIEARRS